jgi:hypothetical protein
MRHAFHASSVCSDLQFVSDSCEFRELHHVCAGSSTSHKLNLVSKLSPVPAVMVWFHLTVALALALAVLCVVDGRDSQVTMHSRSLLQNSANEEVATLRVANFATLIDDSSNSDVIVDEKELRGTITVTPSTEPVLYGAYFLGPSEVAQINHTIATELV